MRSPSSRQPLTNSSSSSSPSPLISSSRKILLARSPAESYLCRNTKIVPVNILKKKYGTFHTGSRFCQFQIVKIHKFLSIYSIFKPIKLESDWNNNVTTSFSLVKKSWFLDFWIWNWWNHVVKRSCVAFSTLFRLN